ncbi:hypothetical protein C0991_005348, partial [Blastosporella zonata]
MSAATVTHSSGIQAPTVSEGRLTVDTLERFEHHAKRFFKTKRIPANEQVSRILYCFEDRAVSSWCSANEAEFEDLLFPAFIAKIRERWLSTTWFIDYGKSLYKPQNDEVFSDWVAHMRDANLILETKPEIHLDEAHLRSNIRILMNDELQAEYNTTNGDAPGKLDSIEDLDKWITSITHIDDGIRSRRDREHRRYFAHLSNIKKDTRKTTTAGATAADTANTTHTFKRHYALKLNEDERALLASNDGCNNCRQLWIGKDHDCKYRMTPLPYGVVPEITKEYVEQERAKKGKPQPGPSKPSTTRIAAIIDDSSDEDAA